MNRSYKYGFLLQLAKCNLILIGSFLVAIFTQVKIASNLND